MHPATCVPNIGPVQRRRRRHLGWAALGLALVGTLVALHLGAGPLGRLAITPLVLGGVLGLQQSKGYT